MQPRDANPSQGFRPTDRQLDNDWEAEDTYWRGAWQTRPYAKADLGYDHYLPAYRYGYRSAQTYRGRAWGDAEPELRAGWDRYEDRGPSTWEQVKDAVRDAWDRVTNR